MTAAPERLWRIEVTATAAAGSAVGSASRAHQRHPGRVDYDAQLGVDPHLINDLASCRYLDDATDVLMIGRGRQDHVRHWLGLKAVEAGYRTYLTTAADLAARCHRAAIEGRWATTVRF